MIPRLLLLLTISMPHIVFFTCIRVKIQQFISYHLFSNHTTITHGVNRLPLPLVQRTRWSSLMGLLRPAKTDPTYQAWRRCNNMVVSWLTHFVSPSIRQSILWMDKSKEIWKDLKSNSFKEIYLVFQNYNLKHPLLSKEIYRLLSISQRSVLFGMNLTVFVQIWFVVALLNVFVVSSVLFIRGRSKTMLCSS